MGASPPALTTITTDSLPRCNHSHHTPTLLSLTVGGIQRCTQQLWVLDGGSLVHRAVSYVPAMFKCFDEILVNAADNKS